MKVRSLRCCRNEGGVSEITCNTFIRVCELDSVIRLDQFPIVALTYLEILNEPFEKGNEMFCAPDVSWHGLF